MALDHSRLGLENESGQFFAIGKFTLQNLANKSGGMQTSLLYFFLHITSEMKRHYKALFLSLRSWIECSISQVCKTNCTHSIFRTIEAHVGF